MPKAIAASSMSALSSVLLPAPVPPTSEMATSGCSWLRSAISSSRRFQSGHCSFVIFTEPRDTLNYLAERIAGLLGKREAVVTIHGGMGREERKKAQEGFTQDKDVEILVATNKNAACRRCRR